MVSAVINVAPEGNLSRYLQEIRKFPMLSPEEELELSRRWRDHEDLDAAHKLVTSHRASLPRLPWATGATACRSAN